MDNKRKTKKSAIDTLLEWKYNPSEIERRVEERLLSEAQQKIIKTFKF